MLEASEPQPPPRAAVKSLEAAPTGSSTAPVTHSRYTSATAGSGYGLAATPDQFLEHRPGPRGPIAGLYFAGGNLRSGHGISGALASGAQAVRVIERDGG